MIVGFALVLQVSAVVATTVSSSAAIVNAFANPPADHVIAIADGTYTFGQALKTSVAGSAGAPIRVTGSGRDSVKLVFTGGDEGIRVSHAYWTIENVHIDTSCLTCYGAGVHVKIGANDFTLKNARVTNWYQGVKSDRDSGADEESDRGVVEGSEFYVDLDLGEVGTMINIDGGEDWRIEGNFVHDIGPSGAHYGIFVKGGNKRARILRNLVICSLDRPTDGAALGISFGGGGMGTQYCPADNVGASGCACEAFDALAANNIVLDCNDAGLHTKRACDSTFAFNTVLNVGIGLQIQGEGRDGGIEVIGNTIDGNLTGSIAAGLATDNVEDVNVLDASATAYADVANGDFGPGVQSSTIANAARLASVTTDYCGTTRGNPTTYGAVQHPEGCDALPWPTAMTPTDDGAPVNPGDSDADSDTGTGDGDTINPPGGTHSNDDSSSPEVNGGCAAFGPSFVSIAVTLACLLWRRRKHP